MRLLVAAVGRARSDPAGRLFEHYAARLQWPLDVKEVTVRGRYGAPELRAREAAKLLSAVPEGARTVALDPRGKALTSRAFAARLRAWEAHGAGTVAFLIGGAEGLDPRVRRAADLVLSLGPMTWPHLMVRAMLAEQLYRAQAILRGHPYHRE